MMVKWGKAQIGWRVTQGSNGPNQALMVKQIELLE